MAILHLKSTNPEFSYAIRKNPESGMTMRTVRQGVTYGWFLNKQEGEQSYAVHFQDGFDRVSYPTKDQKFDYLSVTKYNSPSFVLNTIASYFKDTATKFLKEDVEDKYTHTLTVESIYIHSPHYIKVFKNLLQDIEFETELLTPRNYRITITTNKSLYYLLNVVHVVASILLFRSKEEYERSDGAVVRHLQAINAIDPPYYIRQLFVRYMLDSKQKLEKFHEQISETDNHSNLNFLLGNTQSQRREKVQSLLSFEHDIVDIGCGEGYYLFPFAKKLAENGLVYHAVDTNGDIIHNMTERAKARQVDNVKFYTMPHKVTNWTDEKRDYILVEVIEHMSVEAARILINSLLQTNFNQIIITTPNKSFNKYYGMEEEEMRHEDHKWEMTTLEFIDWILDIGFTNLVNDLIGINTDFFGIGDTVDNRQPTQGVVITRRELQ